MRDATDGACPAHNEDDNSISATKYTSVANLAGVFSLFLLVLRLRSESGPEEQEFSPFVVQVQDSRIS
jgi:hypothetical protein